MESADKPDKPGKEEPVAAGQKKVGQRPPKTSPGPESAKRRNRRAQRKDQQIEWRNVPGNCWPSPSPDDGKTE